MSISSSSLSSKETFLICLFELESYSQIQCALLMPSCAALVKWTTCQCITQSWIRSNSVSLTHTQKPQRLTPSRSLPLTLTQYYWGNSVPRCSPLTERMDWTKKLAGTAHCCVAHSHSHCWGKRKINLSVGGKFLRTIPCESTVKFYSSQSKVCIPSSMT